VIASDVGGIPEIITHQHNGLLCQASDSEDLTKNLLFAYNNPQLWEGWKQNAHQTLKRFDAQTMISENQRIYEIVVTDGR
jgi:glycosyltransferase involved in cell wall biosynthesis